MPRKAKANQALQTSSQTERAQFATEYNELLGQIEDLAKDAGYGGKNLLGGTGNDLSVVFNEDGTSSLSISAVDYTDSSLSTGLNLSDLATATDGVGTLTFTAASTTTTLTTSTQFTAGDTLTLTDANGTEVGSITVDDTTTIADLESLYDGIDGVSATSAAGALTITSEFQLTTSSSAGTPGDFTTNGTDSGFATDAAIESTLTSLKSAQDTLRAQASTFGTNLSIVENRQDFTKALINTLEEGAGKLTLADTNEEGANLLALQTQQTLASTSLSLAAQADQNVLRLF